MFIRMLNYNYIHIHLGWLLHASYGKNLREVMNLTDIKNKLNEIPKTNQKL